MSYKGVSKEVDFGSVVSRGSTNARIPADEDVEVKCGDITSDTTWTKDKTYVMSCQIAVTNSAVLTIEAGTTVKAYPAALDGFAPTLIVTQGSRIMAEGTATQPITFTTAVSESNLPARGLWGGLIILGNAQAQGSAPRYVEGVSNYQYGGSSDTDNSGVLKYVRVWYGGHMISQDNEINGITLAGVGSGTTVEHCEVA